jgi:hypothetical protein
MKRDRELRPGEQPFWNVRGTQRRQRVANGGESMTGNPRNARLTETRENVRQPPRRTLQAGGHRFDPGTLH